MSITTTPLSPQKELEAARTIIQQQQKRINTLEADYEKARNHATNLTRQVAAYERAARAFESATGQFSFACFCCAYKDRDNSDKCDLLGDEVCEDLENWEFGYERFSEDKEDSNAN